MMRTVWVILVVAAALRVAMLACAGSDIGRAKTPDSDRYIALAQGLAQNGQFETDGRPEIFRTPGYPVFLRLFVPIGEHWWQAALAAQAALDVLLVYIVLLLGRALLGEKVALLAAAMQAISPLAVANSVRLLSDSLFALLLMLGVLLLVLHVQRRTWATIIGCAAALSAACYIRPVGLVYLALVFVFMLVALVVAAIKGGEGRSQPLLQFKHAGAFILVCILALAPWLVRNALRADYLGFSSFASDSVYFFAAPEIVAKADGVPAESARRQFQQADADFARAHPDASAGEVVRFRKEYAGRVLHEHPMLYARLHLAGAVGYFMPGSAELLEVAGMTHGQQGTLDVLHKNGPWSAIRHYFGGNYGAMILAAPMAAFELAIFVGAILFALRRKNRDGPCLSAAENRVRPHLSWLLVAMVIISPLLSGPFGLPRYRLPMMPLWILAGAAGWLALRKTAFTTESTENTEKK